MEIGEYIGLVRKRLWLIILFLAMGLGMSWYYSSLQVPIYTATATVAINPAAQVQLFPYLGGGNAGFFWSKDQLASVSAGYQQYLQGQAFTTLAVQRLNLSIAPESLPGVVSTSLVRDTNFLRLSVQWDDPREAQRVANGIISLIVEQLDVRGSNGSQADIQALVDYYNPRVAALRSERERVEKDQSVSPKDRAASLAAVDSQLTPMLDLYIKLKASLGQAVPASETALLGAAPSAIRPATDALTVMDWAALPAHPEASGRLRSMAVAGVAALILGVALAILLEYMDNTLRTPLQLKRVMGAGPLAIIGKIPRRRARARATSHLFMKPSANGHSGAAYSSNGYDRRLIAAIDPSHPISEAFRRARTLILERGPAGASQVLLVTSGGPGEGKSLTLANLAVAAAHGGKSVIVVDADLRKPTQHKMFGLSNEAGLCAVLAGEGNASRWLQATEVENLSVLTAGRPKFSPADVLSSPRLAQMLEELKRTAGIVLIDSPALSVTTEALMLAPKVDGVLLVADAGSTTAPAFLEAKAALELVGANIVGATLTRFSAKKKDGYYYGAGEGLSLPRLGEYLIKSNFLTANQLRAALKRQAQLAAKGEHKRIGEVLVEMGYVIHEEVEAVSSKQERPSGKKGSA